MLKVIRKWNEINDYNFVLSELEKNNLDVLKCLYDTYEKKFSKEVEGFSSMTLAVFFMDMALNPNEYRLRDGNVDVELFVLNKFKNFIKRKEIQ